MPRLRLVWIVLGILNVSFLRMWFSIAGCHHHDLEGRDDALPVGPRHQHLADDADDRDRELHADLLLLLGRELVDDAVDGARRAGRVQRAEHEVAGLGGRDRRRDRLEVAHLAEQDDVGVLAQRAPDRLVERRDVGPDLALRDDRLLVLVEVLDRVLDRDDVASSFSLMWLTIVASVVVLPDPVGPVTRSRPRGRSSSSMTFGESPICSNDRSLLRDQAAAPCSRCPCCGRPRRGSAPSSRARSRSRRPDLLELLQLARRDDLADERRGLRRRQRRAG